MNAIDETTINAITSLHDIRGPVDLPGEWLWLVLVFAVVVCIFLLWWVTTLLKRKPVVKPVPTKPAWEIALDAMVRIESAQYIQNGRAKEFYSELSLVVRCYIEQRFDVHAPEMTTEEFMHKVQYSKNLTGIQQQFLSDFLNASDMVKFAKFVPAPRDMFEALRLARVFVEETK